MSRPRLLAFALLMGCTSYINLDPSASAGDGGSSTASIVTNEPTSSETAGGSTSEMVSTSELSAGDLTTGGPGTEDDALKLKFSQVKRFDFSWAAVNGASSYRLLERATPNGSYVQIGADIVGTSTSWTMPLHLRFGASYILQACDNQACTDSAAAKVMDSMASAIGYFKASNTGAGDKFGSVALAADGNTLAVGSPFEDSAAVGVDGDQANNAAKDAGAVYVYVRANGVWSQQAYVKASNAQEGDQFGVRLALSADGHTLVIGAPSEDSAATGVGGDQANNTARDSGAVYVFVRANDVWSQQAYVKASNAGEDDNFGASIALSADGDTLAVGARLEDSAATGIDGDQSSNAALDSGAGYLFVRANDVWSQQAYIKASNTAAGDNFGGTLALSADGDTLAIGAPREDSAATGIGGDQADNTATDAGAAYVFVRTSDTWSQQAYMKASNAEAGDQFGGSAGLSGDGNTLAVGAPGEDSISAGVDAVQDTNFATDAGAVYVFSRTNTDWSQQVYIKPSNPCDFDAFGTGTSLSADGKTLAVNALGEASAGTGVGGNQNSDAALASGAVYVFSQTNNAWWQRAYVKAPNTAPNDQLGSLALSGDGTTLAVGAALEDSASIGIGGDQANNAANDAGAVYVY